MTYINPPFNYTGSKYKLLPQILPKFDYTKKNFIDLFAGGGSVYSNVVHAYEKIWVNDIIAELIGIHKSLLHDGNFLGEVKSLCVNKDDQAGYVALRGAFNKERKPSQLFALMLCCTNNMMRFNQSFGFNQTFGKRTFNESTAKKVKDFVEGLTPYVGKIHYSAKEFGACWPTNPSTSMIYIDPPYYNSEAGYNAYWSLAHEERLYNYIKKIDNAGGSFALSGIRGRHKDGAESSVITNLIADGYKLTEIQCDYDKVARNKTEPRGQEILITNY